MNEPLQLLEKYNENVNLDVVRGSSIAIGAFDGCHLGHNELLSKADYALAFWPLPKTLFSKDIKCLSILNEKKSLYENFLFVEFDKKFASRSAEYFMDFIENSFAPSKIVVGWDFRFGRRLEGGVLEIEQYIKKNNLKTELIVIPPVMVDGEIAKSTAIRDYLAVGNLEKANSMLGYDFFCISEVVKGKGVGKTLGFPTINLVIDERKQLPLPGVYAGTALVDGQELMAAISLLDRGGQLDLEAFLLDFKGDIYGEEVKLSFHSFIRESIKFENHEQLSKQIAKDVEKVSEYLACS